MGEWTVKWTRWNSTFGLMFGGDQRTDTPDDVPLLTDRLAQLIIKHQSILANSLIKSVNANPASFTGAELSKFANELFSGELDEGYKISDLVAELDDADLDRFRRFVAWTARSRWIHNEYELTPVDEVPQGR